MSTEDHKLLTRIVLKNRLASEEQVQDCLEEATALRGSGRPGRLIDILLHRGILQKSQVKAVLNAYHQTQRIQQLNATVSGYQCLRDIGHGTAGTVYLARQLSIGRDVAIKVLDEELASNPGFIRNFHREAKSAARLNHPNVIQAIDVGEAGGHHYFVMEYVEGESLQGLLKRQRRLDEARVLHVGMQMAAALQHAYQHGLIHRDVKPGNILLNSQGSAKLCDLGLARPAMSEHTTTAGGISAGTPAYMSPEQAIGRRDLDFRTDLFSLGATLYHLVTGTIPFKADNLPDLLQRIIHTDPVAPFQRCPSISQGTNEIICSLMGKDRENRPESPEAARREMERHLRRIPAAPPLPLRIADRRCYVPPTGQHSSAAFEIPILIVSHEDEEGVAEYSLSWSHVIVGRHSSADIQLKEKWISRQQFRIFRQGGDYKLEAVAQSSRMELNGQRVKESVLEPGDEITIHKTKILFELRSSKTT